MNNFKPYKKPSKIMKRVNFYNIFFGTKIRRIITSSLGAFCFGAVVAWGGLSVLKILKIRKSIGGLETSGVPEFNETTFDKAMLSNVDKIVNNADDTAELDAAAEVLDTEKNGAGLELCYYTYRVKQGDMIGLIADSFNITQDTIISVNNIHQSRLLQIGQYLKIPSMPGILYTVRKDGETLNSIAEKYEVSAEKCARINSYKQDTVLNAGENIFIPDAQLDWVTRQEINGDLFHKPLHARYYLSSYYGWRSSPFTGKRSFHSGIDMAAPSGTSVYAALSGTVTTVGYNSIYGNYIIVTHHSGYKTLYGHLSATLVTRGRYVDTSTKIGKVGNTGMSTGPHLHFTVFKFGKTMNPLTLLK
ncbi:MAG: peptidoglycan DD-metalloendopeptidase family protein [Treponema sp.]